jgi:hypothetical protein
MRCQYLSGFAGDGRNSGQIRDSDPDLKMPKEKLPEAEIALLEEWVQRGAPDPRAAMKASARQSAADWWAVKSLAKPEPPDAGVNPIDAFIRAKLPENGLAPSPEADRPTLNRRLTFDLHGLPPSPEEVETFANDPDPGTCEKLVDWLLASPRYGERWARHWLDVAHYGESDGFDMDRPRLSLDGGRISFNLRRQRHAPNEP